MNQKFRKHGSRYNLPLQTPLLRDTRALRSSQQSSTGKVLSMIRSQSCKYRVVNNDMEHSKSFKLHGSLSKPTSTKNKELVKLKESILTDLRFMLSLAINKQAITIQTMESCLMQFLRFCTQADNSFSSLEKVLQTNSGLLKVTQEKLKAHEIESILSPKLYTATGTQTKLPTQESRNTFTELTDQEDKIKQSRERVKTLLHIEASNAVQVTALHQLKDDELFNEKQNSLLVSRKPKFLETTKNFVTKMKDNRQLIQLQHQALNKVEITSLSEIEFCKLVQSFNQVLEKAKTLAFTSNEEVEKRLVRTVQNCRHLVSTKTKHELLPSNINIITHCKSTQTDALVTSLDNSKQTTEELNEQVDDEEIYATEKRRTRRTAIHVPWANFMNKLQGKGKGRKKVQLKTKKLDLGLVQNNLVGDIYMKKAMVNQEAKLKGFKRRSPLAKLINHYFTQKYGLKKMAEEYVLGLIQSIKENEQLGKEKSHRISLFGKLLGVILPKKYNDNKTDVLIEFLTVCFKFEIKQIAPKLSQGEHATFIPTADAIMAIKKVFFSLPSFKHSEDVAEKEEALFTQPTFDTGNRVWPLPLSFKNHLLSWVDDNSKTMKDMKSYKEKLTGKKLNIQSSRTMIVDVDDLLSEIHDLLTLKDKLDETIFIKLFLKHDFDQNGVLSFEEFSSLMTSFQCKNFTLNMSEDDVFDAIECGMLKEIEAAEINARFIPDLSEDEFLDVWDEVNHVEEDDDLDNIEKESFARVCLKRGFILPYWKINLLLFSNVNDVLINDFKRDGIDILRFSL